MPIPPLPPYRPRTYHAPNKTTWRCAVDGELWPCPEKRAALLELYRNERKKLGGVLGQYYMEMVDELDEDPVDIYQRVLAWLPRRRAPLVP